MGLTGTPRAGASSSEHGSAHEMVGGPSSFPSSHSMLQAAAPPGSLVGSGNNSYSGTGGSGGGLGSGGFSGNTHLFAPAANFHSSNVSHSSGGAVHPLDDASEWARANMGSSMSTPAAGIVPAAPLPLQQQQQQYPPSVDTNSSGRLASSSE
jgi:hypothetical protein